MIQLDLPRTPADVAPEDFDHWMQVYNAIWTLAGASGSSPELVAGDGISIADGKISATGINKLQVVGAGTSPIFSIFGSTATLKTITGSGGISITDKPSGELDISFGGSLYLNQLADVSKTPATTNQVLVYENKTWTPRTLQISHIPNLQTALDAKQPLDADLTAIAALSGSAGNLRTDGAGAWTVDTTSYQPLDGDLTAIAALAGTTGFAKKTAANTWTLDTSTYLTANQTITLSGGATGSGTTSIPVTLSNTAVTGQPLTGYTAGSNTALAATDTILVAFGKLQAQVSAASGGSSYLKTDGTNSMTGNLNFSSTGQRIIGDFSNATNGNRVLFQTSTANGLTSVGAMPNGTGVISSFNASNSSDTTNYSVFQHWIGASEARLISAAAGTGTLLPIDVYMSSTQRHRFGTDGRQYINTSSGILTDTSVLTIVQQSATGGGITCGAPYIPTSGNSIWGQGFYAYSTGTTWALAGSINIRANENWTSTAHGSLIQFRANALGTATLNEVMTIDGNAQLKLPLAGTRIKADFSNSTSANRTFFQDITATNTGTSVGVLPPATSGITTALQCFGLPDPANSPICYIQSHSGNGLNYLISGATGTGAQYPLAIQVNGAERARIDTSGNLLIGRTTGSGSKLDIQCSTNAGIAITDGTISGALTPSGLGGIALLTTSSHILALGTANTERARFLANGALGIATTAPERLVHIGDKTGARVLRIHGGSTNVGDGSLVEFGAGANVYAGIGHHSALMGLAASSDFTIYNGVASVFRIYNGAIGFTLDGSNNATIAANISTTEGNLRLSSASNTERSTSYINSNLLRFYTGVLSDGAAWFVASGTDAGAYQDTPIMLPRAAGATITFSRPISTTGNISAYSDERIKSNWLLPSANFVAELAEAKVGTYNKQGFSSRQAGISAQSALKILPEVVSTGNDGWLMVDYGGLTSVSVVMLARKLLELEAKLEKLCSARSAK